MKNTQGMFLAGGLLAAGLLASCGSKQSAGSSALDFNPEDYKTASLVMPSGDTIQYKAYEGIFYVENVEDSTY